MKARTVMCTCPALIAVAALGLASAGAEGATFCTENKDPCPVAKIFTAKTVKAETTTGVGLLNNSGKIEDVECEPVELELEAQVDSFGEFSEGSVEALNLGTCKTTPGAVACGTATAIDLPYELGLTATGSGNGTLAVFEGTGGPPAFEFVCGTKVDCTFSYSEAASVFTGSATAPLIKEGTTLNMVGAICPEKSIWESELTASTPTSLFAAKEAAPPKLCESNSTPNACAPGEVLGTGTAVNAKQGATSKFTFTFNGAKKEPTCPNSTMVGETTAEGRPIVGKLTEWTFPGNCAAGLCKATAQHLPYRFEIDRTGGGNGTFKLLSGGGGGPAVTLVCPGLFEECTYGASSLTFKFEGSATAPRLYSTTKFNLSRENPSSLLCSTTGTWEGSASEEIKFELTKPAKVFVTS